MTLHADRVGRRALTLGAAAGSILAATLTFAANPAHAAYTAQVKAGTLQIRGDAASDKLVLAPTPPQLLLDVGDDGTVDFTFDRTTGTEHSVLREDFYYRTETLVALADKHGLDARFMDHTYFSKEGASGGAGVGGGGCGCN